MKSIPLEDIVPLFDGHVDCLREAGRLQPVRYRAADAPFLEHHLKVVATFAAGIRLRFKTDSRTVRFGLVHIRAYLAGYEWQNKEFELCIDALPMRGLVATGGAQLVAGGAIAGNPLALLTLEDLPPGEKQIELWLPHTTFTSFAALEIDDDAYLEPWPDRRRRILFHGSSITQAIEANSGRQTWPAIASAKADARHLNLGWSGCCLISGFAARLLRDEPADAIVLELGANVFDAGVLKERTFLDSTHSMLSIIREKHSETPIAVISPISWKIGDEVASGGGITLGRMRELLTEIVTVRRAAGDANLHYLSGTDLSGPADLDNLPDGTHPNEEGNRKMGERFYELMLAPGKPLALDAC
jgi:lysophospholipase L1-like esterase